MNLITFTLPADPQTGQYQILFIDIAPQLVQEKNTATSTTAFIATPRA